MLLTIYPKHTHSQTVQEIFKMAKACQKDVLEFPETREKDLLSFYNFMRGLPYIADPKGIEWINRPAFTYWRGWTQSRDCDDKTCGVGAFCNFFGFDFRIVICGEEPDEPHHVYPEVWTEGRYMPFDTTYPWCSLGTLLYVERYRKVFYPGKKL